MSSLKIIGCGTGRSGTKSLSRIIGRCRGIYCTHEEPILQPWEHNEASYQQKLAMFQKSDDPIGDVYSAYLPSLRRFFLDLEGLRVVCVEREREEVVRSFLAWTKARNINHWMRHDGTEWNRHGWDIAFPKFDAQSKAEAIGLYWDHYYEEIRSVRDDHPDAVLVLPIEELNTRPGQEVLFDFLGLAKDDRYFSVTTQLNRGFA